MALVDGSDVALPSSAIGSSSFVRVTLKNSSGAVVVGKLVTFVTDPTIATLSQQTALTDSNGVARVKISPVNVTAAAAGSVSAAATVDSVVLSTSIDFQTSAANVILSQFAASVVNITALQSSAVTVKALVNGNAAASGQVAVAFSASCGSFSPTSASTNSSGIVSTVYQSTSACSGNVTLTAQAAGSTSVNTVVNVAAAQASNILFDSIDQNLTTIFTSRAPSGIKQATLKFKVVDASNAGMASQNVLFDLSTTAINAGVTFSDGTSATQTVPTDASGIASVTIVSGALPTPVVVTGKLQSAPTRVASSLILSVTSGVPTQDAASLSASKLSIEGFNYDGETSDITFRIADRQGNPVPAGTAVTFVASHGLVGGTCNLNANSACTVIYTSQGTRPVNGRVAILAYLDGEESFVDIDGNNIFSAGDTFTDVGTAYRDDNEDGVRQSTEQLYPGGMVGTSACSSSDLSVPFVANTCDGIWSSSIRVRKQLVIALATSHAAISQISRTNQRLIVSVADDHGNGMPTGTAVSAAVTTVGSACSVISTNPGTVMNSSGASSHTITLNGDATCSSATIAVTVTTPKSFATITAF
ncbi:hypothetical protein [Variovorax terrae]|uniref:Big-1 domain-containing protein n=1 Tax=Variovorax terrae TaxID=2923278 RepID=A0A9X2ANM4_9BURK|nr:hypothetical protein [Variovorax terrae]MCJ0764988.1 hypothetical protein [Variovorax terrae]